MKRIFQILLIISVFKFYSINSYWDKHNIENKALIIDPVVDVVIRPLTQLDKSKSTAELYDSLAYAPEHGDFACLRLHQLLFNEVVIIKREYNEEIECELPSFFYYDKNNNLRRSFWMPKKSVVLLKDIYFKNIKLIPAPYTDQSGKIYTKDILTLTHPWYNQINKKTYSVGTRFIRESKKDKQDAYAIILIDQKLKDIIAYIPKNLAVVDYPKDKISSTKLFLDLIKSWSNSSGILPYVWGGCSYDSKLPNNNFSLVPNNSFGQQVKIWIRPNVNQKICTGFECSSLILRAAQIYGLPYFCKNTTAISKTLRPLAKNEKLENGDLIWYSGHVLIVSDIDKNKLIESVGYFFGYGKLHEINLEKIFKDIKTYNNLLKIYFNKGQLKRLNNKSKIVRNIPKFLILKLNSIWDKK